jgi:ferredoxin like protein
MSSMTIEQRLALNTYEVDTEPHIRLKEEICRQCERQSCLYVCPAECFKAREGKISFNYEGCLECGSCHISCSREAIEWSYPRGHFGVSYEYG